MSAVGPRRPVARHGVASGVPLKADMGGVATGRARLPLLEKRRAAAGSACLGDMLGLPAARRVAA